MCMVNQRQITIPQAKAYKIFTRDKHGQLQTVFAPSSRRGLKYPPNRRIRVDEEDACFFGFVDKSCAFSVAKEGRKRWNIVEGDIIVLPVTMYEIVSEGKFFARSYDPQCLDGLYPCGNPKKSRCITLRTKGMIFTTQSSVIILILKFPA